MDHSLAKGEVHAVSRFDNLRERDGAVWLVGELLDDAAEPLRQLPAFVVGPDRPPEFDERARRGDTDQIVGGPFGFIRAETQDARLTILAVKVELELAAPDV